MAAGQVLEVLGEPAAAPEPAECPLYDPAFREHVKALGGVGPFDDVEWNAGLGEHPGGRCRALIAAIGHRTDDRGMDGAGHLQERGNRVAVLHVGGRYEKTNQQAERIDRRMPLLAFDFLARVISHRIDADPPFSALLTLWLSTMASVGEAFLAANSRHFVYSS